MVYQQEELYLWTTATLTDKKNYVIICELCRLLRQQFLCGEDEGDDGAGVE